MTPAEKRLREALEQIAGRDWFWAGAPSTGDSRRERGDFGKIAYEALADIPSETEATDELVKSLRDWRDVENAK